MDNFVYEEVESVEGTDEDMESSEKGFMRGYSDDDEVVECSECGSAIDEESKVTKDFDGDTQIFCSKICLDEFEENM